MKVDPSDISATAAKKEQELENDFFMLLYLAGKKRDYSSFAINAVEWSAAGDCLDQINYRYADFYALLAFAVFYPTRNRLARGLLARYWPPLYLSLVGYDCGIRATSQYPAITYWNTVCVLNTDMGDLARTLNSPQQFYEVVDKANPNPHRGRPLSFFEWLGEAALSIAESLFLQKVIMHTLEGSCWKEKQEDNTEFTSLVLNSRFFKWHLLNAKLTYTKERVIYEINTSLLPTFGFQRNMRRSYSCRRIIMEHSSVGARLWYGANFALMRLVGAARS